MTSDRDITELRRPNRLTVCLIVRDEAERLGACLESLATGKGDRRDWSNFSALWDELVVVDTGSVDDTVTIAESYGARVEHFEWCDDYAAARNYAETFATGDYVFWIDGDETLVAGHELIREIVARGEEDAVRPACRGSIADDAPHLRQELLRRRGHGQWQYPVHESLTCPPGRPEPGIVYQHHERTAPERSPELDDRWAALRKRVAAHFDHESLGYLAREYAVNGMWHEAVAFAELALAQPHPEASIVDSELAIVLGNAYRMIGQRERSLAAYRRAVTEYDGWAEPFYSLALAFAQDGRPDRAVTWVWASLPLNPVAGHSPFGESLYVWRRQALLGQCYARLGRIEQAVPLLREAVNAGAGEGVPDTLRECEKLLRKKIVVAR